jgi:hypothetical protein
MHIRICENCGDEYRSNYPLARWCCAECRVEFRNAELREARKLLAQSQAGKPRPDTLKHEEVA